MKRYKFVGTKWMMNPRIRVRRKHCCLPEMLCARQTFLEGGTATGPVSCTTSVTVKKSHPAMPTVPGPVRPAGRTLTPIPWAGSGRSDRSVWTSGH